MSDLQCPASFVLLSPETAETFDTRELRLALVVCTCPVDANTQLILQRLAAKDGCPTEASTLANAAELVAKIDRLADHYRGEQVAIVASPELIREVMKARVAPTTGPIHLAVDSDGRTVRVE